MLRVTVELAKATDTGATFKADRHRRGGPRHWQARVELAYFNLADRQPELAGLDPQLVEHHRHRWAVLTAVTGSPASAVAV